MTPKQGDKLLRGASFVLASAISLLLLIYPRIFGPSLSPLQHSFVALLLLAVCAAFVHGIGFIPEGRIMRRICVPVFVWPAIMLTGAIALSL